MKVARAIAEAAAKALHPAPLPEHKDPKHMMDIYLERVKQMQQSSPISRLQQMGGLHRALMLAVDNRFRKLIDQDMLDAFDAASEQLSARLYDMHNQTSASRLKLALIKLNQKGLGVI